MSDNNWIADSQICTMCKFPEQVGVCDNTDALHCEDCCDGDECE